MKETKREICERHEPIAYYSGLGGLEVRHIECGINDYLYLIAGTWNGSPSYHRLKIYYEEEQTYIKLHGCKCPLSEFIRA